MKSLKTILDSGVGILSVDYALDVLYYIKLHTSPSISSIIATYSDEINDLTNLLHNLEKYGFISVDRRKKSFPVTLENEYLANVLDGLKNHLTSEKTRA